MSDLAMALAQAGAQREDELIRTNPYFNVGASMRPIDPRPYNASAGSKILAGLTQGLVRGGLMGYGQSQAEGQQAAEQAALAEYFATSGPERAAILARPELQSYAPHLMAEEIERQQREAEDRQKEQMLAQGPIESPDGEFYYSGAQWAPKPRSVAGGQAASPSGRQIPEGLQRQLSERYGIPPEVLAQSTLRDIPMLSDAYDEGGAYADDVYARGLTRKREIAAKLIYPRLSESSPIPDDRKLVRDMRQQVSSWKRMGDTLERVAASGTLKGLRGTEVQAMLGEMGMLMNDFRIATNSGANFTLAEQKMIKDGLPAHFLTQPAEAIKRALLGQDQSDLARLMAKAVKFRAAAGAINNLGQVPQWVTPDLFSEEYLEANPKLVKHFQDRDRYLNEYDNLHRAVNSQVISSLIGDKGVEAGTEALPVGSPPEVVTSEVEVKDNRVGQRVAELRKRFGVK